MSSNCLRCNPIVRTIPAAVENILSSYERGGCTSHVAVVRLDDGEKLKIGITNDEAKRLSASHCRAKTILTLRIEEP